MKPRMKFQGPRAKVQVSPKFPAPSAAPEVAGLGFGVWSFLGPWTLGLGPSALC